MPDYKTNVYMNHEARDNLMIGVNLVADAVKKTLGAKGTNAILQEPTYPFHIVTNDGISIAQKICSEHPVVQIGINIMREVADRANKDSGDGTTTAMTLAQAILKYAPQKGIQIMRELNACLPILDEAIDRQKKPISVDEVASVATISAESEELGKILQEIYQKIGKDGIVELDNSGTFETTYEIKEGIRLRNAGYFSPYMANTGTKAVYSKPNILITKQRIATLSDIDPLFKKLSQAGINEAVLFVDDIDASVLSALAYTHVNGIFKTLVIKAPVLWKDWLFEDFAKVTGATIVEPASGVILKDVEIKHLGTCDKLITTREETTIVGIQDISQHIANLKEIKDDQTKLRLSWLTTQAATLKLGANSESELSYKRLKAEDARNAAYLALRDGVVAGGGVALIIAAKSLPNTDGGNALKRALEAPLRQIIDNAGGVFDDTVQWGMGAKGYDARNGEVVDMWAAGIVDPATVVKNSVRNAISVAGTVLTADTVVVAPQQYGNVQR